MVRMEESMDIWMKIRGYERTVKEPDNGSTVVSTIDLQLQSIVEQHILEFNEEHKNEATQGEGSKNTGVIVMNPQNGEILAEASYPNYDLNNPRDLTKYYTEEQLKKMTNQEKLDTLNDLWNNYVSAIRMSRVRHSNHLQFPRDLRRGFLQEMKIMSVAVSCMSEIMIFIAATVPDMDRRV